MAKDDSRRFADFIFFPKKNLRICGLLFFDNLYYDIKPF